MKKRESDSVSHDERVRNDRHLHMCHRLWDLLRQLSIEAQYFMRFASVVKLKPQAALCRLKGGYEQRLMRRPSGLHYELKLHPQ